MGHSAELRQASSAAWKVFAWRARAPACWARRVATARLLPYLDIAKGVLEYRLS